MEKSSKRTRYSALGALRAAVDLAHPRDRSRAIVAAQRALQAALSADVSSIYGYAHLDYPIITRWESHPKTTLDDAKRVFDSAIKRQGQVNIATSKVKGRK